MLDSLLQQDLQRMPPSLLQKLEVPMKWVMATLARSLKTIPISPAKTRQIAIHWSIEASKQHPKQCAQLSDSHPPPTTADRLHAALNASSHYARGKTLGGCSARNYIAYQRGSVDSYKMWVRPSWRSGLHLGEIPTIFRKELELYAARHQQTSDQYNTRLSYLCRSHTPITPKDSLPSKRIHRGELLGSAYVLNTIEPTLQTRETSETAYLQPTLTNPNLIVYIQSLAQENNLR